ncbi:MAG: type I-E CRISPR-associated protein Cas7/Cse4/CasC [Akkermansiaceae bacterium]|jgi:CRISPR system Cascade subunit CasC|nr:type I-E CRISPR-associated protein Cas7/Cse4/CasC [Akkermansiaceae bacterium]
MKLIELHILQSFPVSCLNRDDVGSPKSAVFGGVTRARISSQCLKRAARMEARENSESFQGIRSRFLLEPFAEALKGAGLPAEQAAIKAKELCEIFSKPDSKKADQVTTAVYLSPAEIQQIAKAVASGIEIKKAVRNVERLDAADIALFGRMVANDATLNVEGAAMFSHALSTHVSDSEIDFFSAVDDRKEDAEDSGAGMIGTLEFNTATYYRYLAVNLGLLGADSHLGKLDGETRQKILRDFLTAVLKSVPGARKNSMNAATLPFAVLGVRKDKGQPLQLVNAFEEPAKATRGGGLLNASLNKMKDHLGALESTWGSLGAKVWLPDVSLDDFLNTLLSGDV